MARGVPSEMSTGNCDKNGHSDTAWCRSLFKSSLLSTEQSLTVQIEFCIVIKSNLYLKKRLSEDILYE